MLKINRIFAFLIPLATLLCYILVAILLKMAADQIDALDAVADSAQISNTVGDLQAFMVYMIMIIYLLRNSCLYDYTSCDSFLIIITNYVWFTALTQIRWNDV